MQHRRGLMRVNGCSQAEKPTRILKQKRLQRDLSVEADFDWLTENVTWKQAERAKWLNQAVVLKAEYRMNFRRVLFKIYYNRGGQRLWRAPKKMTTRAPDKRQGSSFTVWHHFPSSLRPFLSVPINVFGFFLKLYFKDWCRLVCGSRFCTHIQKF